MQTAGEPLRWLLRPMASEQMSQLFFIVNQDLLDGSAHALYCFRNCWWMARVDPGKDLELISPASNPERDIFRHFGYEPLPNFTIKRLPAVRKAKGRRGVTINLFYYWAAARYLQERSKNGDWLISASFAKLFRFLLKRSLLRQRVRVAYEVHQLTQLDYGRDSPKTKLEMGVLSQVDCLVTTTEPLRELLREQFPQKPVHNLRLACGFSPDDFPRSGPGEGRVLNGKKFTVAYIGSLYREQGVEWLVGIWPRIQKKLPRPAKLEIAGGTPAEVEKLRRLTKATGSHMISLHGAIPPRDLPAFLAGVDALIIPTLAEGRMPYVAITKAYDYPGLNRPIIASNLPSISSILRDGQEGLLFIPGQEEDCARALGSLMERPELAARLVKAGRDLAGKLSWKARAEAYLHVLKSLAAQPQ